MTHYNNNTIVLSLLLFFFALSNLTLSRSAEKIEEERPRHHRRCAPFQCGDSNLIQFPFTNTTRPECGLYTVNCTDSNDVKIQLKPDGHWYRVESISQAKMVTIKDEALDEYIRHPQLCHPFESFGLPYPSPISNVSATSSLFAFNCTPGTRIPIDLFRPPEKCGDYDISLVKNLNVSFENLWRNCLIFKLPWYYNFDTIARINLTVVVSPECYNCHYGGGQCRKNYENEFYCENGPNVDNQNNNKLKLGLGLGLGIPLVALSIFVIGFVVRRRFYANKRKAFLTRNVTDPYLNPDPEQGTAYYGIPVFPYKDLQEATDNFDSEKELGDGGFGTVYYGVLKDGREVAVKRLYEHNYKRLEQFMNEIKILTSLRHPNLVTLYGCTSRRSRELLLVYEFIPNGTVADHLHGDRAHSSPLHWPARLRLAIETASALAYLHASDIVHRDVKTTNILLDKDFRVKVADFGLSRLFPADATHVSTAPQGTPGYVDPEYHQCYQLTSKSDVYSFGVVLIELISSMPAVDITRHKHEINLSNMAVTKISKQAYCELVDPMLKFDADDTARTAIIAVAELAFQCLQQDNEIRPTMEEVLEELKRIQDGRGGGGGVPRPPPSPECDDARLLKEPPLSPNGVTENWPSSRSITPNISA